MSGVEIDFSVDGGESTAQEDEGNETETGASPTQATAGTGGPLRIQGRLHS